MDRSKRLVTGLVATLAVISLVLTGCWSGATGSDSSAGMEPGAMPGQPTAPVTTEEYSSVADDGGPRDAVSVGERMLVRTATLDLRVDEVERALAELRGLTAQAGGEIAELSVSGAETLSSDRAPESAGPTYATVTIRVPAQSLDTLVEDLSGLGVVVSRTEGSSDVTEQAVDLEARLENLRAEERRLRTFLDRTTKVSELLEVQRELARVRGDIEAMDAQLTYLKRQVARATLQVSLSTPGPVAGTDVWFGFRDAFAAGVQGAVVIVGGMITALVASLPFMVLGALVVLFVRFIARRRRTVRTAETAPSEHAQGPGADDA